MTPENPHEIAGALCRSQVFARSLVPWQEVAVEIRLKVAVVLRKKFDGARDFRK